MPVRQGGPSRWGLALLFPTLIFLVAYTIIGKSALGLGVIVLLMAVPLRLLPRRPLIALPLVLAALALVTFGFPGQTSFGETVQLLLLILSNVLVGRAAVLTDRYRSVPAAVLAVVTEAVITDDITLFAMEILAGVTAWVIGNSLRQRRLYAAAQRAEAEIRAVQAERLRIARELHDMIAHSIGVIAVQAGMGRRVIDTQPAEAREALANIEESSRDTAAALRRMLGTLRRNDTGAGPSPLDPVPGLGELDALIARTGQAGLRVELLRSGSAAPLPPDIDLSAYRIVQEALTNVLRHAGTDRCTVAIEQGPDSLDIEVSDDGRGAHGTGDHGYGLSGMRERVSLLGGDFSAGPGPSGGFRVHARIPLPPA